jgi:DNA polymerase-3 subunit delta'
MTQQMNRDRPWIDLLAAVRARGGAAGTELEALAEAELELTSRKERKRVETEWTERIRRTRRRVQTGALDLALQLVALWFADLAFIAFGAPELLRNCDRTAELAQDPAPAPARLRAAVELVEETRERFLLNVSEDLACEALAYRLERTLAR